MSPIPSLPGLKHLRSWIPLPFACTVNNPGLSTGPTNADACSAIEAPEHVSTSSAPIPPIHIAPTPRPPPRHSSTLTARQPCASTPQHSTTDTALKENAHPPMPFSSNHSNDTTPPPTFSSPILASTPPATPVIDHIDQPQRPSPTTLTHPPQPRGRTLTRSTSVRRTPFPSHSSNSLRQRTLCRSISNNSLHPRPTSPHPPPPQPPSQKIPRYLGRHPSIDRTQLRSARLPPLQEQGLLPSTPPLLSRRSEELRRRRAGAMYPSPSSRSSFSSLQVVEDEARLYCGGEEKPGFVKVRSERQLREVVLRQGGGGGGRASDDSGRTTRGGSEVPDRGFGFGCGWDGSVDGAQGESVGLLGEPDRGKKRRLMVGRDKGLRGRVGRLGRRLSGADRRRRKRKVEGQWEWDGEERGKEEFCE